MGDPKHAETVRSKNKKSRQTTRQEAAATGPALPGQECRIGPHESWNDAEEWAWGEICAGRIADFNDHHGLAEPLDPNKPDKWDAKAKNRRLSPAFLEAVLLHDPWRGAIPRQGVRIAGALFSDPLDLSHARLNCQLWLDECPWSPIWILPIFESMAGSLWRALHFPLSI